MTAAVLRGDTLRTYCTCGHVTDEHLNGGPCRAGGRFDDRCDCISLDIDDESSD